jgi:hypothetical protein
MRLHVIRSLGRGLLFLLPAALPAQKSPTTRLDRPTARHPAEWTSVVAIRELGDGKVLVLDAREQIVKLVDFQAGSAVMVGARGNGPGEYVMPTGLYALPGDSSLIFDEANSGRPVVVDARGIPARASGSSTERPLPYIGAFSEVDSRGRIYSAAPGSTPDGVSAIQRVTRSSGKVDTVGYFSRRNLECAPVGAGQVQGGRNEGGRARSGRGGNATVAFPAIEEWAVSDDGRTATICAEPYRVMIREPGRKAIVGPAISYPRVRVTNAEKEAWRELRAEPVAVIRMGPGGTRTAGYEKRPAVEPAEWPDVLPPFVMSRGFRRVGRFAPDGTLWIERAVAAGTDQMYDVVARDAKLMYRVIMPARTRVIGFGSRGIYAVVTDDDDIQRLVRFSLPSPGLR